VRRATRYELLGTVGVKTPVTHIKDNGEQLSALEEHAFMHRLGALMRTFEVTKVHLDFAGPEEILEMVYKGDKLRTHAQAGAVFGFIQAVRALARAYKVSEVVADPAKMNYHSVYGQRQYNQKA
jgi:hypothetical protein